LYSVLKQNDFTTKQMKLREEVVRKLVGSAERSMKQKLGYGVAFYKFTSQLKVYVYDVPRVSPLEYYKCMSHDYALFSTMG